MKNYKLVISILVIAITLLMNGCSKDTPLDTSSFNSPFVAVYYPPYVAGTGQWQPDGYIFYDLDHDDNKDKKFFIARFKYVSGTGDKMEIYKGPLPIDSIAQNWPPEVKSAGFGYNTDMVVNAYMGMRQIGIDTLGRTYYDYDSLKNFNNGWGTSFSEGASWLNGKTPQGFTTIKIPDGVGNYSTESVMFYFKENNCTRWGLYQPPIKISSLAPGAGVYDWVNVNSVLNNKNIWGFQTHIFIDFKNWRYFTWQEECAAGGCLTIKLTMSGYKSLDDLLEWPEGWEKK